MDRLWAPWRKAYIRPKGKKKPGSGCLFCRLARGARRAGEHVLAHSRLSFAVLNLYPYNNGHVLVLPRRHVKGVELLTDAERLDWLALYVRIEKALRKALRPHGINIGINLGIAAGAGIPGHLHLHVVPRWKGDVNFMPVLGHTKVISESLESVHRELTRALGKGE